ncbi:polygalacturonase-1 non-catalytic subunit beta [Phtheirospermum japonicum]|uniref:Polygalacturonase-1 non-catalytic subunit beta n=1 Tax=Phtheirospermum japonicum TaxID=374723 RepID=A0A830D188_9LAMI|nr:polygalacturonase-1 non-catalytic subunit beta [Phtheirospermum japonicum]
MHPSAATLPLLLILCSIPSLNVVLAAAGESPFSPKASLIRYWSNKISNNLPKPEFLLNKASPLTAAQYAAFSKLAADQNKLSEKLPDFCSTANLLCFPDLSPSLEKHSDNVNFRTYAEDRNFTNYGTNQLGGADAFQAYSVDANVVLGSFRRYSRGSTAHDDKFNVYATNANVIDQSFNTYGTSSTGGEGQFSNFSGQANAPNLRFQSYSDDANGRVQSFTHYSDSANSGDESFASYGKNGNGAANSFTGYGKDSNVIGSSFVNYGEKGNAANDTFTNYGTNTNVPENNFKNYGNQGNGASDTFTNYRDQANVGDDSFQSYATKSNAAEVKFVNYGQSFNEGTDKFKTYGKGATGPKVGFQIYGVNNSFTEYNKVGATFASYKNTTPAAAGGKMVNNKWSVEPGKFFKEAMLKNRSTLPMPDVRDKMPQRSFLPRVIVSKLPFSSSKITEMKKIFRVSDDGSSMSKMMMDALADCERPASAGETKRCVASIEDMIDFATSVLGRNVAVRSIKNTQGYNSKVMLGNVIGINGGKVTKSVSCHQSLFPYMLYYCHSVPNVRVYEADILDPNTEKKINQGVAICHLDTTAWSPTHGAFIALGSSPGKTEVCHFIFEGDMTWAVAD